MVQEIQHRRHRGSQIVLLRSVQRSAKRKPGWLARLFLRRVDAVTSRAARLAVVLWPAETRDKQPTKTGAGLCKSCATRSPPREGLRSISKPLESTGIGSLCRQMQQGILSIGLRAEGQSVAHLHHILCTEVFLHIPAAFHGLQHGDFVGVLDVAAHRDAHGDAGDLHPGPLELL